MKAMVYRGPGRKAWETVPDPVLEEDTDVIVRVTATTICGTDLHILQGDVPDTPAGTILGHEAVGVIEEAGAAVRNFRRGDRVIVPAITACGQCESCRRNQYSQCARGGWILGHRIHGVHAQLVRVPFADTSLYGVPEGLRDEQVLFLTDVLPTAYECGVLPGQVRPGDVVVVVGLGPVGLAAIMLSRLFSPGAVIAVGRRNRRRLERARQVGADVAVQGGQEDPVAVVRRYTGGRGADVVIESVGTPEAFRLCTEMVAPGGRIASLGVYGRPVTLPMDKLWNRNVTITTRLVNTDSISQLLALLAAGRIDPTPLVTHTFPMDDFMQAYEVFENAVANDAIKVVVKQ